MELAGRFGALAERNFRLVFSSTSISAIAGPVSAVFGIPATLIGAFIIESACFAVIISQPSVWSIRSGSSRGWESGVEAAA